VELQRGQQRGERPPVVVRVGTAQLVAHPLGHRPLGRLQLPGQRGQRLHPARHHRVHRVPHRVIRALEGGVDHPGEDAALARHVRQLADQLLLHPPLGPGVDPVDEPDQQLHQAVDKLCLPRPAQRRQQRVPPRLRAAGEVRGVHAGRTRPPGSDDPVRGAAEHRPVQPERPHRRQLADLGQQRVQSQRPRVGFQLGQHVQPRQQVLQPTAYHGSEPPGGRRGEVIVEPPAARGDHALYLAGARRLHLLAEAAPPQRGCQAVPVCLRRAYLLGQPLRPAVLVVLGRRPRPIHLAYLGPVVLDRPARPGVLGEQRRVDLHQRPEIPDRSGRDFLGIGREPALDLVELQHHRETEPGHARLVRDQVPVATGQRPRADQLIRLPLSLHPVTLSLAITERRSPPRSGTGALYTAGMPHLRPLRAESDRCPSATLSLAVAIGVPGPAGWTLEGSEATQGAQRRGKGAGGTGCGGSLGQAAARSAVVFAADVDRGPGGARPEGGGGGLAGTFHPAPPGAAPAGPERQATRAFAPVPFPSPWRAAGPGGLGRRPARP